MDCRSPLSRVQQCTSDAPLLNQYDPLYSRRTYPRFIVPGWAHMLLGLLLLILGLADIGYTCSEYGSNCLYTGSDFKPGPCKADHVYTYVASPVWGGIIMMLTGSMAFWMTSHRLRFNMWILKAFCGFSIFLVIIICPAIIVLNILEIVENKNTFWKDDGDLILYDDTKFYIPIGIMVLAFLEWIVAIISACVCVCCLPRDLISGFNDMCVPMPAAPYCEYFPDRPQPPIIIKEDNPCNPCKPQKERYICEEVQPCNPCNPPRERYICKEVPECRNDPIIIRKPSCQPPPQPQYIIKQETCRPQPPPPPQEIIIRGECPPAPPPQPQYIIKQETCRPQPPTQPQEIIIRDECPPAPPPQPIIIKEECRPPPPQQPVIVREEYIQPELCEIPSCIQEEVLPCPPQPCEVVRRPSYMREEVVSCPPPPPCPTPIIREEVVTCPPPPQVIHEEVVTRHPPASQCTREEVVTRQSPYFANEIVARPALLPATRDRKDNRVVYEEHIRPGDRKYDAYRSSNLDIRNGRRDEDLRSQRSQRSGYTDYGTRRRDNNTRWNLKRY